MIHRIFRHYKNPDEERINQALMDREFEDPIQDYVEDCFASIQDVIDTVELTDIQFIVDEDEMDGSIYDRTRSNKKQDKKQKIYHISKSRVGQLNMKFHVVDYFDDEKVELDYVVRELIPIPDEHGKLLLRGVSYTPQYQLTETSTYVTSADLVMKSLMPIRIKKVPIEARTTTDEFFNIHSFHFYMLEGFVNIFLYYFASMGVFDTIEYFNVGQFITLYQTIEIDSLGRNPECYYFECTKDIILEVKKDAFNRSDYIRTIVGTLLDSINGKMTFDELMDLTELLKRIGTTKKSAKKEAHEELGRRYKILYARMFDKSSRKTLRTTWHNKEGVHNVIRWICQNYDTLKKKDNLDINFKRLRCNQYIGFAINKVISEHIKKFVNTSCSTKDQLINKYKIFFSFKGTEVINNIHSSGLMKYDDLVNDLNVFQKFKVTMKGPNSLGNKNSRNIAARQRELHPSHIGILGLDTCSSSEPGITNYINPLCETEGLFFKDAPPEPEDAFFKFMVELGFIQEDQDGECFKIDPVLFNNTLEFNDHISVTGILKDEEE